MQNIAGRMTAWGRFARLIGRKSACGVGCLDLFSSCAASVTTDTMTEHMTTIGGIVIPSTPRCDDRHAHPTWNRVRSNGRRRDAVSERPGTTFQIRHNILLVSVGALHVSYISFDHALDGELPSIRSGCACRKSHPAISMVQSAQHRTTDHASRVFGGAQYRSVLVQ
jgi:hypothetical protein